MSLSKVTYVDGQTVIHAQNLNDIQDEVIANGVSLGTKAPLASPTLTGTPKAPTASASTDNTQIATTAFANRAAANAVSPKYEKPSGGIPKTDLASSVQTSLGKADTAIQLGLTGASVGDLVRVAAVDANGKPTSWNHVPLCDIVTNENLLDNGYFVGGGSQQGAGFYPFNQRGQTSYNTGGEYTVDRWYIDTDQALTVLSDSIKLAVGNKQIRQRIENFSRFYGKNLTGTILLKSGELYTGTVNVKSDDVTQTFKTFTIYSDTNKPTIRLRGGTSEMYFSVVPNVANLEIAAAKLELGSEQTLAHQEDGVWVLNELPDYGEELAKCQRFYFPLPSALRIPSSHRSASVIYFPFTTPVAMAGLPTLNAPNAVVQAYVGGTSLETQSNLTLDILDTGTRGGIVTIRATNENGHGLINSPCIVLRTNASFYLSCET